MSRYHPVRQKKPGHNQQQPNQQAAPMPTEAQMEQVARQRFEKAMAEAYKLRHGDVLDEAIERRKRLLRIHDREAAKVEAEQPVNYRWTVSPRMVTQFDKELEKLEQRRDELKEECWEMAREILGQIAREATAESLCPPKQNQPATAADSRPTTKERAPAQPGPIAA
jgi:hypothetical protein